MRAIFGRAILVAALLLPVAAPATDARAVFATLNGHAISVTRAGELSCHDFEYPAIRCFDSVGEMEADAATRPAGRRTAGGFVASTTGYVEIFQDITYAGSAAILSNNVPWLSSIGWNDKISSFKSFGATGRFDENSPNGGFAYFYSSAAQVPNVGSAYNDKFSAFFIN